MLHELIRAGQNDVLNHSRHSIDSHLAFSQWLRKVELWLEEIGEPTLLQEWNDLPDSNLVRNGIFATGNPVWDGFERAVHARLSWLTGLYKRLPTTQLAFHNPAEGEVDPLHTPVAKLLHPVVAALSAARFSAGHYADAVEAAFKEVNAVVKAKFLARTGQELDGASLMTSAFSPKNPVLVLGDITTDSGRNIQQGYMQIFSGAMTGIRNPKAHANLQISEERALHLLLLASLLMHKIDEIP